MADVRIEELDARLSAAIRQRDASGVAHLAAYRVQITEPRAFARIRKALPPHPRKTKGKTDDPSAR